MGALLIGYFVYLLVVAAFAIAALYHCFKYSNEGDKTQFAAGLYLLVMLVILIGGFVFIGSADFSGEAA